MEMNAGECDGCAGVGEIYGALFGKLCFSWAYDRLDFQLRPTATFLNAKGSQKRYDTTTRSQILCDDAFLNYE
jgi:hypothetical protein